MGADVGMFVAGTGIAFMFMGGLFSNRDVRKACRLIGGFFVVLGLIIIGATAS